MTWVLPPHTAVPGTLGARAGTPCVDGRCSVPLALSCPSPWLVVGWDGALQRSQAAPQTALGQSHEQVRDERQWQPAQSGTMVPAPRPAVPAPRHCAWLAWLSTVQPVRAGSARRAEGLCAGGWGGGGREREGANSSSTLIAMPSSMRVSWAVVLPVQGDKSLPMQFQYGCSVAPPTFVVLKLNTFVYKSLKCIAKTCVLAVIAGVNLFVILQRLGEVFHKYVRSGIKILWQAARVENSTVTSQQGTSTLTHNSLVIDGISVPCSFLEMR